MKLSTRPKTKHLFFEPTSKYTGGLISITDMFSHGFHDESREHYTIYRYPIRTHTGRGSKYCKLSSNSIRTPQIKK